jgi:tartrate dehydrogenase/decarboxylase/D-malate dehydrogenase
MAKHRIAVVAGDGIGKEVMPEGLHVMDAAARKFGIDLQFDHFDFSSWDYYEKHGKMLPDNWKDQIGGHEAIYFGAVGWPEKLPTMFPCGARCCFFAASSTSTSTCAPRA